MRAVSVPLLAVVALVATGAARAEDEAHPSTPAAVIARVNEANRSLRSWSASFTERHHYVHFDYSETRSGEIRYRRGAGLRIDLVEPDREMVLVDAERALQWRPKTNQVHVFQLPTGGDGGPDPDKMPIPLPIGGDGWDPLQDHAVRLVDDVGPELVLELIPNEISSYQRKMVWIDPRTWLPSGVRLVETTDDEIHYSFTSIQVDPEIDVDRFRFEPPDGAEVVRHDQLPRL